jgi:hypothetical protein
MPSGKSAFIAKDAEQSREMMDVPVSSVLLAVSACQNLGRSELR